MRLIFQPTIESVIKVNQIICSEGRNPHQCLDSGKIESAISSAFYPGSYPFSHGGLAKVPGALCFYLVKSHAFLDGNKITGGLAKIIEACAASKTTQEQLKDWFETHKVYLDE